MHAPRIIPATRILRADRNPSPRRFAACVTAAATAVALVLATALPARADRQGDDLAKALLGILVIGGIVSQLDKTDRDSPPKYTSATRRVPAVCAIQISGKRRDVTVYPESCLRQHGVKRLPDQCGNDARIYGKRDRIYGEDCLREAGFRLPD